VVERCRASDSVLFLPRRRLYFLPCQHRSPPHSITEEVLSLSAIYFGALLLAISPAHLLPPLPRTLFSIILLLLFESLFVRICREAPFPCPSASRFSASSIPGLPPLLRVLRFPPSCRMTDLVARLGNPPNLSSRAPSTPFTQKPTYPPFSSARPGNQAVGAL